MYRTSAVVAVAALLTVSACDKPSDKVKREYELMLKNGATLDEQCKKMREIAAAYLVEENEAEYGLAHNLAEVRCHQADLKRQIGY